MAEHSYKRSTQLGNQLHREIGRVMQYDVNDPRLQFVTVTEVRLTDDLKDATVFVSIMGEDTDEVFNRILRAGKFIRKRVGDRAYLKYVPRLNFKLDTTREHAARIEQLLAEVRPQSDRDSSDEE